MAERTLCAEQLTLPVAAIGDEQVRHLDQSLGAVRLKVTAGMDISYQHALTDQITQRILKGVRQ